MIGEAHKILKYAEKKADYVDVRVENLRKNRLVLKNGNLEIFDSSKSIGICIRIIKNGAMGVAFSNSLKFSKMKKTVSKAIKLAKVSKKILKQTINLSEEKSHKDKYEVKQVFSLESINSEERIKFLVEVDKDLIFYKFPISMRFFEFSDEIKEKYYVNSEGSRIYSKIPRLSLEYLITVTSNGLSEQRMFQLGGTGGWEIIKKWNLRERLFEEAEILTKILKAKKAPNGRYDVILSPELVGIISHESCGHPYEADRILGREAAQAGESFITKDMIGEKIGSDTVNLVDDPTLRGSYGFYLYDDEGVKAKRRYLIKNGVINTFLHNRETAFEFGIKSNGSARATDWRFEPIVRMANTFVLPGDYSFDELIDVRNGIYIKSYMEWNIDDKRFNQKYVGLESYLIKNGEIKTLIRRPVLEITTPKFYSSIDAVGKDLAFTAGTCGKGDPMQGVPVWFGGPHLRLRNIRMR
jgi:TldD protein